MQLITSHEPESAYPIILWSASGIIMYPCVVLLPVLLTFAHFACPSCFSFDMSCAKTLGINYCLLVFS